MNRQKDIVDGKNSQLLANALDNKLREDLERLKKIRSHRGVRHSFVCDLVYLADRPYRIWEYVDNIQRRLGGEVKLLVLARRSRTGRLYSVWLLDRALWYPNNENIYSARRRRVDMFRELRYSTRTSSAYLGFSNTRYCMQLTDQIVLDRHNANANFFHITVQHEF